MRRRLPYLPVLVAITMAAGVGGPIASIAKHNRLTRPSRPSPIQTMSTYYPTERTDVIKNPGVGYETFYQSAARDRQFPSSTMYFRISWSAIEARPGTFDFGPLDSALSQAQASGQRLAFRIMAYEEGDSGPVGLRNAGFPGFTFAFKGSQVWFPNLDESVVRQDLGKLIAALGQRYGQSPAIDSIDIGIIGDWGEQHFWKTEPSPPYPRTETLKWLFDEFRTHIKGPLVVNDGIWWNDKEAFHYAISKGLGWRADCWGGRREMQLNYPLMVADVPNAWKSGPVIVEPCGVMSDWVLRNSQWQRSLQWAVDNHVSKISNKSEPIPAEMLPAVGNMLTKLGYRVVLRRAAFPTSIHSGSNFAVQLNWSNTGNAPMYFDRHVLVRIGTLVKDSRVSMQGFLPGDRTDTVTIGTAGLAAGTYPVQIGLAPPGSETPDITLAIRGDGPWYMLGKLVVRH
ncbi:DUF4832 domain-containing protein [Mesorhizobium sp. WSM3859]|uniref:DUF4832 domain-containing protein n=1 Tax=Mesorhizobium sp. WSM3859 TaxID=2029402 RepID=UPI000BB071A1|nr:DUF4832 domain-containing protein [Mesorhizobium sp. WSM3859]PBC06792.1 hypothetical protein CK230_29765 [Mesorhizobium sp. WSM3859]